MDSEKAMRIAEGHGDENNEVTGNRDATEGKVVKGLKDPDLSKLDLTNKELLKLNKKRPAEDTVPAKRSARFASSETSSQVSKMHAPRPFDAGKHKGNREDTEQIEKEKTSQSSETSHQKSEVDAAAADVADASRCSRCSRCSRRRKGRAYYECCSNSCW